MGTKKTPPQKQCKLWHGTSAEQPREYVASLQTPSVVFWQCFPCLHPDSGAQVAGMVAGALCSGVNSPFANILFLFTRISYQSNTTPFSSSTNIQTNIQQRLPPPAACPTLEAFYITFPSVLKPGPQRLFQKWLSFYTRIASINATSSILYDIQSGSPDLVCFLNITSHHALYLHILPSACLNVPFTHHLLMFQESSLRHT